MRHPPLRLPDHLSDPQALHLGLHSVPQNLNVISLLLIGECLHPKCLLYGLLLLYNRLVHLLEPDGLHGIIGLCALLQHLLLHLQAHPELLQLGVRPPAVRGKHRQGVRGGQVPEAPLTDEPIVVEVAEALQVKRLLLLVVEGVGPTDTPSAIGLI